MGKKITEHVTWVGKVDWEIRAFHGEEFSTHHGSTYNAYLIRDTKNVVVDTVWTPFAGEFVRNLAREIPLESIDAVVANHAEADHSGALPELMRALRPGTPVYCTANAVKSLRGHYHADWNFQVVKTGDRLSLGSTELVFVEMPMLHWPDSLAEYLTGDKVLLSNDAFGQHYASEVLYNDLVDQAELYAEAIKYYANILTPFSRQAEKKLAEVAGLGLDIAFICPSHGVIWRQDPLQVVRKYQQWAAGYKEHQVTIVYDTMWGGTRRMAEAVAEGLRDSDPTLVVKLYNAARSDRSDVITEIFKAKALAVGCPTVTRGLLYSIAGLLEEIKGLKFQGKVGGAFGAYGWSGESAGLIAQRLAEAGFEVVGEGVKAMWSPDEAALEQCRTYGRELARRLAGL